MLSADSFPSFLHLYSVKLDAIAAVLHQVQCEKQVSLGQGGKRGGVQEGRS